mmetsp:Transcript_58314/g.107646  ORF Transcript_58314/g.107646 Transcript_58314/m.107646 type:complete len:436 (-) Transcript_58314:178-1485(-)
MGDSRTAGMALFLYGVAALQLVLGQAVQLGWNSTQLAAAAQLPLHMASKALRQRVGMKQPKVHNRRLQRAASGPCTWQGGACAVDDAYQENLIMDLPAGSEARLFFEMWQVCSVKSVADCATSTDCYWDVLEAECTPLNNVEPSVNDWFDFDGCGILESVQDETSCTEETSSCASIPGCVTTTELDVGSSGLCESQLACEYTGNIFARVCGSGFDIDNAMSSCQPDLTGLSSAEEVGQAIANCVTQACPAHADYWNAFFPAFFRCLDLSPAACGTTTGCTWDVGDGECAAATEMVMSASIPSGCAVRDFFLGIFDCEARSLANCESSDCTSDSDQVCRILGSAPSTINSCTLRPDRMFASLASATCDNRDAQAYTRTVLVGMECSLATTDSQCSAVTDTQVSCRSASHAGGIAPLCAPGLIVLLILSFQKLREAL